MAVQIDRNIHDKMNSSPNPETSLLDESALTITLTLLTAAGKSFRWQDLGRVRLMRKAMGSLKASNPHIR